VSATNLHILKLPEMNSTRTNEDVQRILLQQSHFSNLVSGFRYSLLHMIGKILVFVLMIVMGLILHFYFEKSASESDRFMRGWQMTTAKVSIDFAATCLLIIGVYYFLSAQLDNNIKNRLNNIGILSCLELLGLVGTLITSLIRTSSEVMIAVVVILYLIELSIHLYYASFLVHFTESMRNVLLIKKAKYYYWISIIWSVLVIIKFVLSIMKGAEALYAKIAYYSQIPTMTLLIIFTVWMLFLYFQTVRGCIRQIEHPQPHGTVNEESELVDSVQPKTFE
jgi:hypothetical protein